MDGLIARLRVWLFRNVPAHGGKARRIATALIHQIVHGGLRTLNEHQLIELVNYLLTSPPLRKPLRGNTRFLQSVSAQYSKKGSMSDKQRQAIYNILEKAYPHNLAAELRHFADRSGVVEA